jgi:hypothetical protein
MINYNKNKLINKTLDKYYETFSHTLDTVDFVPEKYNDKIRHYIFKNMKRAFRKIDKEDKIYQREINKKLKIKEKMKKNAEKTPKKHKFLQFFKKIFKKNKNIKED